jgi:hypothetical protein
MTDVYESRDEVNVPPPKLGTFKIRINVPAAPVVSCDQHWTLKIYIMIDRPD